jgi:hypothetical protein
MCKKLRTVFTGDLLKVQPGNAQKEPTTAYILMGTYVANTLVIGALPISGKPGHASLTLQTMSEHRIRRLKHGFFPIAAANGLVYPIVHGVLNVYVLDHEWRQVCSS